MPFRTGPRFMIFSGGYVLFLCIGACIFLAIEEDEERIFLDNLQRERDAFLEKHPCVHYSELQDLIQSFEYATHFGIAGSDNTSSWNFGESLFFATTIVTTVGYGHMTPLSLSGRIFTVLFATIGIPLTLSILSALVDRLYIPTHVVLQWLHSKLRHTCPPFYQRLLHLTILSAAGFILFILIPAVIYWYIEEEWCFIDSLYFCFLTVTTIGLGDFTPGDSMEFVENHKIYFRTAYKLCTTIYLFLGVMYAMLTLAVFCNIPELNLGELYTTETGRRSLSILSESESLDKISTASRRSRLKPVGANSKKEEERTRKLT